MTNQGQDVAYQRAVVGITWLCVTAVADAIISITLTVALARNRTGYNTPTDGILNKVMPSGVDTKSS